MISDDESSEKFVLRTLVVSFIYNWKHLKFLTRSKAGFAAGTIQDIALYPLDSIKSRLQNEVGFWKSGGFRGIYKGISLAVCASGPAGALFFGTYEASKSFLRSKTGRDDSIGITIVSATFSEIVACLIRVPIENAKTRRLGLCRTCDQYKDYIFQCQVQKDGLRRSLYRGFSTRIVSYLPFAFIQVPLWDYFRLHICDRNYEYSLATLIPIKLALCGALSSAVTAIITTPLDVAVNRAMQCPMKAGKRQLVFSILKDLYLNRGFRR